MGNDSSKHKLDLSIVIVNWNTWVQIEGCLKSIYQNTSDIIHEVYVVDNASVDGSVEMVREKFPTVELIVNDRNVGFSHANNQAIERCAGKYVLLLNSDTLVVSNALQKMVECMESSSDIGAVGCKILRPDGSIYEYCARNFPSLTGVVLSFSYLPKLFPGSKLFQHYVPSYRDYDRDRDVECLVGAAMMIRHDCLDEVGLLDERIPMYFEDIDICYRVRKAGWRIRYLSSVTIIHLCESSSEKLTDRFLPLELQKAAYSLFFREHHGTTTTRLFTLINFFGAIFRILLSFLFWLSALLLGSRNGKVELYKEGVFKYLRVLKWSIGSKKKEYQLPS
jgi:GT2 family glycosyltransferase